MATYSEERINNSRQIEFDYVKTIAIIFMVIIHVYEELSTIDTSAVPIGFFHNFLQFMAGPLAAPAFMFSMGLGAIYTKSRSPEELIRRGIKMFITAYVLNIARNTIPYLISCLASGEVIDVNWLMIDSLNIDILHFAGLAFIAVGISKKLKVSPELLFVLSVLFQFVGTQLSIYITHNEITQYIFGLFFYTSDMSCFPFLQWFIYPVAGILFAKHLKHIENVDSFYRGVLYVSAILTVGLIVALSGYGFDIKTFYMLKDDAFYRQTFLSFLFTISCVCLEISLLHFIREKISYEKIDNYIKFMSSNLTNIYYVQWLIIGWTEELFLLELKPSLVIPIGLLVTIVSVIVAKILVNRKTRNVQTN